MTIVTVLTWILKKISPFQEGIISETIQRPDKMFFQKPKSLEDIIDVGNLIHKFLPKQMDIDKILQIIHRKVLKGTHLPIEIKEIQQGIYIAPTSRKYTSIYPKTDSHILKWL